MDNGVNETFTANVSHVGTLQRGSGKDNTVNRENCTRIMHLVNGQACCESPRPVMLGKDIMRELKLTKTEFFMAIGQLLEYGRIGVMMEGRRRYYYSMEMINALRERKWRK